MYSFGACFSADTCPRVGLQGHMVALFLVFYGTSIVFSIVAVHECVLKSLQSCLTLCGSMDCSPSSVHGILQARTPDCRALLQGIFPTQRLNLCFLCLLHWQAGPLPLAPPGKSIVAVPIYIPINSVGGFPSLHTLSRIFCLWIF